MSYINVEIDRLQFQNELELRSTELGLTGARVAELVAQWSISKNEIISQKSKDWIHDFSSVYPNAQLLSGEISAISATSSEADNRSKNNEGTITANGVKIASVKLVSDGNASTIIANKALTDTNTAAITVNKMSADASFLEARNERSTLKTNIESIETETTRLKSEVESMQLLVDVATAKAAKAEADVAALTRIVDPLSVAYRENVRLGRYLEKDEAEVEGLSKILDNIGRTAHFKTNFQFKPHCGELGILTPAIMEDDGSFMSNQGFKIKYGTAFEKELEVISTPPYTRWQVSWISGNGVPNFIEVERPYIGVVYLYRVATPVKSLVFTIYDMKYVEGKNDVLEEVGSFYIDVPNSIKPDGSLDSVLKVTGDLHYKNVRGPLTTAFSTRITWLSPTNGVTNLATSWSAAAAEMWKVVEAKVRLDYLTYKISATEKDMISELDKESIIDQPLSSVVGGILSILHANLLDETEYENVDLSNVTLKVKTKEFFPAIQSSYTSKDFLLLGGQYQIYLPGEDRNENQQSFLNVLPKIEPRIEYADRATQQIPYWSLGSSLPFIRSFIVNASGTDKTVIGGSCAQGKCNISKQSLLNLPTTEGWSLTSPDETDVQENDITIDGDTWKLRIEKKVKSTRMTFGAMEGEGFITCLEASGSSVDAPGYAQTYTPIYRDQDYAMSLFTPTSYNGRNANDCFPIAAYYKDPQSVIIPGGVTEVVMDTIITCYRATQDTSYRGSEGEIEVTYKGDVYKSPVQKTDVVVDGVKVTTAGASFTTSEEYTIIEVVPNNEGTSSSGNSDAEIVSRIPISLYMNKPGGWSVTVTDVPSAQCVTHSALQNREQQPTHTGPSIGSSFFVALPDDAAIYNSPHDYAVNMTLDGSSKQSNFWFEGLVYDKPENMVFNLNNAIKPGSTTEVTVKSIGVTIADLVQEEGTTINWNEDWKKGGLDRSLMMLAAITSKEANEVSSLDTVVGSVITAMNDMTGGNPLISLLTYIGGVVAAEVTAIGALMWLAQTAGEFIQKAIEVYKGIKTDPTSSILQFLTDILATLAAVMEENPGDVEQALKTKMEEMKGKITERVEKATAELEHLQEVVTSTDGTSFGAGELLGNSTTTEMLSGEVSHSGRITTGFDEDGFISTEVTYINRAYDGDVYMETQKVTQQYFMEGNEFRMFMKMNGGEPMNVKEYYEMIPMNTTSGSSESGNVIRSKIAGYRQTSAASKRTEDKTSKVSGRIGRTNAVRFLQYYKQHGKIPLLGPSSASQCIIYGRTNGFW